MADADTLTVAVAQPIVVADDLEGNADRHAALVRAADARVVVFPELSLTGYRLDAPVVDPADARLSSLIDACRSNGVVALAGAPTSASDGDHISVLAVDGDGARVVYHKLYLGGTEPDRFKPGSEPTVLVVDGWRLGLAVCRDTGVAEHAERTATLGIDAYLAGVCEHAADEAVVGERAGHVATTHGVLVGMASFAGSTGEGYAPAAGRSGIWSRDGRCVAQADASVGRTVTTVLRR